MQQENEDRLKVIQKLQDEDQRAKDLKAKKKVDLSLVIQKDKDAKQSYKDKDNKIDKRTNDFGEDNVLSYVY
jgi:hypothetical protein